MTEDSEASVLTARRAAQHVRLSRANDACEHLYILTIRPSLGPLHLMLADTPWPRGFGAALASVGTLFQGLQNSSLPPRSALYATRDETRGLIEFLLSRQSFSAALQVALRVARDPGTIVGSAGTWPRRAQFGIYQRPATAVAIERGREIDSACIFWQP